MSIGFERYINKVIIIIIIKLVIITLLYDRDISRIF